MVPPTIIINHNNRRIATDSVVFIFIVKEFDSFFLFPIIINKINYKIVTLKQDKKYLVFYFFYI